MINTWSNESYLWLVVQYVPILKNDGVKVNGKNDIPYMKWKIKAMFQTTNQNWNTYIGAILEYLVYQNNIFGISI